MSEKVKKLNESNVIGHCANKECSNELTSKDEYLVGEDDHNLYCDSICYTKYMLNVGAVKEIKY